MEPITPEADREAAQLDDEATGLTDEQYRRKMERRKQVQEIPELGDVPLVPEVHEVLALLRQPPS